MLKERESFSASVFTEKWNSLEEYLLYLKQFFAYSFIESNIPLNANILELGFGNGFGTKILEKKSKKVFGLDVDSAALSHAKQKYSSNKISFQLYDGKKIPFKENFFDAIVSTHVIEHVEKDSDFVSEAKRVLNDKGAFFLTTPNAEIRGTKEKQPWNEFHFKEYSVKELNKLLSEQFNSVDVFGITAGKEILEIEEKRIKNSIRLASFDPLKLRKFFPNKLKLFIKKNLKNFLGQEKTEFNLSDFSDKDFFISKQPQKSLDLFAVCRK